MLEASKQEKLEFEEKFQSEFTQTERVILERRSVRVYKKKQVPVYMVKRILEAGRFAPSAGNCQPWKFIVLRDPAIIDDITHTVVTLCKKFKAIIDYRQPGCSWKRPIANLFIRKDPSMLNPTPFGAITGIADGKLGLWHGAPTVILIFKDVRGIGSPDLDCGIAGQNMVLAAHSMGLGTCWVSFAKMAFENTKQWKRFLGIDFPYKFITSLSVGYPVGKPDGMVARATHPVDWYEDGSKTTIY
jgi:nitroreductase